MEHIEKNELKQHKSGLVSVNKDGDVYRYGKLKKQYVDVSGYYIVQIQHEKKVYRFRVHRLVAETFIPNPKKLKIVNHKNCNKLDNHADNLEWVTPTGNSQHYHASKKYIKDRLKKEIREKHGRINVRIGLRIGRKLKEKLEKEKITLLEWITECVEKYIEQ